MASFFWQNSHDILIFICLNFLKGPKICLTIVWVVIKVNKNTCIMGAGGLRLKYEQFLTYSGIFVCQFWENLKMSYFEQ